jgi:hypothetical protein
MFGHQIDVDLDKFLDDPSLVLDRSSFDSFENTSSPYGSLALRFVTMPIDDAVEGLLEGKESCGSV